MAASHEISKIVLPHGGNAKTSVFRAGFTLVECMLASAILGFTSLVLFEGVIVAAKISHENADLLAAEAVAWDAVWKRFNESSDDLTAYEGWQTLTDEALPQLSQYDMPPKLWLKVESNSELLGWSSDLIKISADVEWGPAEARKTLSQYRETPIVYR